MKSIGKLSATAFAAVLVLTSCALGQGTVNNARYGAGVLTNAPAFFSLPVGLDNYNSNDGCSKQGDQGWGDWGWVGDNKGGCKTVPEGGTTLTYLSLAGLFCLGALVLRPRLGSSVEKAGS